MAGRLWWSPSRRSSGDSQEDVNFLSSNPTLESFSGILPLFPLPNVVFFPGTKLPLHIFEPRYRRMLIDAYRGEKMIGMVLLQEGWDREYFGDPPIHKVACMGKLTRVERLPRGRFNIQLFGLCRVLVKEEVSTELPYRVAKVKLLPDDLDELTQVRSGALLQEAFGSLNRLLKSFSNFPGEFITRHPELPAGLLLDVLAHHVPSEPNIKQRFLEESDVLKRARLVIEALETIQDGLREGNATFEFPIFPSPSPN